MRVLVITSYPLSVFPSSSLAIHIIDYPFWNWWPNCNFSHWLKLDISSCLNQEVQMNCSLYTNDGLSASLQLFSWVLSDLAKNMASMSNSCFWKIKSFLSAGMKVFLWSAKFLFFLAHLTQRVMWGIAITCRLSVNFSYFNLLLWNNWTKSNQTWQKASI